jgi:NADPH:quinone reductase-like Zn-dependent oxidoreductase
MKAIVITSKGAQPKYVQDHPSPVKMSPNEVEVSMRAVSIKNLDKGRAAGKHYSAQNESGELLIPGSDGVGVSQDGKRIYGLGLKGTLAEKALFDRRMIVEIPDTLDDVTAAALPNGVMGSVMALRFKADIKAGDTVLINGATGFTGGLAVQIARYYGAGKIIATGRNEIALQRLKTLGADEIISLQQDDDAIISQLADIHKASPINIVIDYLWGHPAELILSAIKGDGSVSHKIIFVTVGGMAGDTINLSSSVFRSTNLNMVGSGLGSWSREQIADMINQILPGMFQLAAEGKLKIVTEVHIMADIEVVWNKQVTDATRLVVTM